MADLKISALTTLSALAAAEPETPPAEGPSGDALLLENGDYLLLENGAYILLG